MEKKPNDPDNPENVKTPEISPKNSIESVEDEPKTAEVLGTIALITGGIFVAKKVWESNIGGVQEKTKSAAGELVDAAITKAKNSLYKSFDLDNKVDISTQSKKTEQPKNTELDKVIKDIEGVNTDSATNADVEKVLGKTFVDLSEKRDSRFKSIADIDPNFAEKMQNISNESDESIMSFIRQMEPSTRGLLSAAFLSSGLLMEKEGVDSMSKEEVLNKHSELIKDEKYLPIFMKNINRLATEKQVESFKLSEEDQFIATKESIKEFNESQVLETEPVTDVEIMKKELEKMLIERNKVQNKLLKIMADIFKSKK